MKDEGKGKIVEWLDWLKERGKKVLSILSFLSFIETTPGKEILCKEVLQFSFMSKPVVFIQHFENTTGE